MPANLNKEVEERIKLVHTGLASEAHTLGARLCALRGLILMEVKRRVWDAALPPAPRDDGVVKSGHVISLNRFEAETARTDCEEERATLRLGTPLLASHFVATRDAYFRPVPPSPPSSSLPPSPVRQQSSASSFSSDMGGGHHFSEDLLEVSAVDETIKVPMLSDVLRIVAEVHGLRYNRRPNGLSDLARLCAEGVDPAAVFAYGTSFVELDTSTAKPEGQLIDFFGRLRTLFDWYTLESNLPDGGYRKNIDSQLLPGPRWKPQALARFLHTVAGVGKDESEKLFHAVCGKGGSMDLIGFAEACGKVARRLHQPMAGNSSPSADRAAGGSGGAGGNHGKPLSPSSPTSPQKPALRQHNGKVGGHGTRAVGESGGSKSSKLGHGKAAHASANSGAASVYAEADLYVEDGPSAIELIEALLDEWSTYVPGDERYEA